MNLSTRTLGNSSSAITFCQSSIRSSTEKSGFFAAGYTKSYGNGFWDVFVIRTDVNGDTLWTRALGTPGFETGYGVCETKDGGFIITGQVCGESPEISYLYLKKIDKNGD